MTDLGARLREDRATRDAARANFDGALERVKGDLSARGVGGRIADKLGKDARAVFDHGLEVADEHRSVVAGTAVALVLWVLRRPIIENLERLLGDDEPDESTDQEHEK